MPAQPTLANGSGVMRRRLPTMAMMHAWGNAGRALVAALSLISCGEESPPGSSPDTTATPAAPWCSAAVCQPSDLGAASAGTTVSFATDLIGEQQGTFRHSCSLTACHGVPEFAQAGLYLGPGLGKPLPPGITSGGIVANLRRAAVAAPGWQLVVPGDPDNSFLMQKVNGCFDRVLPSCTEARGVCDQACGDPMPPGGQLAVPDREKIRQWILQGAMDD